MDDIIHHQEIIGELLEAKPESFDPDDLREIGQVIIAWSRQLREIKNNQDKSHENSELPLGGGGG